MEVEEYLKYLEDPIVLYSALALGGLLVVLVIVKMAKGRKLRSVFEDYDYQYNYLKSIPLLFKLNKASALSKVSNEIKKLVDGASEDFDKSQEQLKNLNDLILENEDFLELGKTAKVRKNIEAIETLMSDCRVQIEGLNQRLDEILEQESQLRLRINSLKDTYRDIKTAINQDIDKYAYCIEIVDDNLLIVEEEFTKFENAILASKFAEAGEVIDSISDKITNLTDVINKSPQLMEMAKYDLPQITEKIRDAYTKAVDAGCCFTGIKIEETLSEIDIAVKEASGEIRGGNVAAIDEKFTYYRKQLEELAIVITKEFQANKEIKALIPDLLMEVQAAEEKISTNKELNERVVKRYGVASSIATIKQQNSQLTLYQKQLGILENEQKGRKVLASSILLRLKELELNIKQFNTDLGAFNDKLKEVCKDEDEALQQLLKLHLLVNETVAVVNRNHLPSISDTYLNDLKEAKNRIMKVEELLQQPNIETGRLNYVLADTVDFVYKFYNNVNYIIGMSQMAENTIVFCNKYRAMFSDIDSDLTKSEMYFNNGEYSLALAGAITIAERLYPNNYADLIKEYSKQ